ncbi:MAG TPA: chaperone modulator CbpM [Polaromonas sp.]|jgi:chaperone modulatory protein CbpM
MTPHPVPTRITGFILEDQTELTLDDVCRACAAQADMIIQLVDEGVLAPGGMVPDQWRFTGLHMHRAQVALRLQRDLGVNLAGAALALELLDEMQSLRTQLHRLAADV